MEAAARGPGGRGWDLAGDAVQTAPDLADARVEPRHRGEQAFGVGVQRTREQLPRRCLLHDLSGVHDDHAVGAAGHDPEVVSDQHDRHAELALQSVEQLQDLCLDRDVERGRRLVGDQELGTANECHGDHHPLAHATAHLVGIVIDALLRVGDADQRQHLHGARPGRPAR